jgi:hypothetical protein
MRIRLTRKLSPLLNGIDVARWGVGDVIELPQRDCELLVAEGWAVPVAKNEPVTRSQQQAADIRPRLKGRR